MDQLRALLANDEPVTEARLDIFGHAIIADRIARRLLQDQPPSQAVVGRLGAGKTTILHLVRERIRLLDKTQRIRVVAVELWPFENTRAAVQGVIRALLRELAQSVNVVSVRGVAAEYAEAMSAAGGVWSAIAKLQGVPAGPTDALVALDEIATAVDIRLVVWIEDLERFAGGSEASDERLNPIRALLYGLDRLRSVTVLTATTSLQLRFDIEKIARFVEEVPDLPEVKVGKLITQFRRCCTNGADIIDPAQPGAREALKKLDDEDHFAARRLILGPATRDFTDAFIRLCSTPRVLKQALRICLESWEKLRGEIDLDDLLAVSILRESEPAVVAVLRDYLHHLRDGWASEKDRQQQAILLQAAVAESVPDTSRRALVDEMIDFLFKKEISDARPQGVRQNHHADYWERCLAVPQLQENERDQPVLKILVSDDDAALLQLLSNPRRSDAVFDFRHLIPPDRTVRLLLPLVESRTRESAEDWPDREPPGVVPLWRLWLRLAERGELKPAVVLDQVRRAITLALPRNLTLAAEIEQHFVTTSKDVTELMHSAEVAEAKSHLRNTLVSVYDGHGLELARSLKGAPAPVLLWLCWGRDAVRAKQMKGVPFDGWDRFRTAILEASTLDAATMLPQVAGLLVREIAGPRRTNYELDYEGLVQLFGGTAPLRQAFASQDAAAWTDRPWVSVFLAGVRNDTESP